MPTVVQKLRTKEHFKTSAGESYCDRSIVSNLREVTKKLPNLINFKQIAKQQ